jgi:hypothetical protein
MINLEIFKSPANEIAVYKNIPIDQLNSVRAFLRANGHKYRFIFRGPRTGHFGSKGLYTTKSDAVAFSVYKDWNL